MSCNCTAEESTTFFSASKGMCRECRTTVDARYIERGGSVYLERNCPTHGKQTALVAKQADWYLNAIKSTTATASPPKVLTRRTENCPGSCGPCPFHAQRCHLPVFSITNACDLRCPICFTYNRADKTYFMPEQQFVETVEFVLDTTNSVDLINITGGEPTLHPQLIQLLGHAKRPEIGRITLNTNGLHLVKHPELAEALADLGVYLILSLDTLDPTTSKQIHGRDITREKRQALELFERLNIPTTLLMVLIRDVNEAELPQLIDLTLEREFVRSLTIQTMTYTGQGGGQFQPRAHLPVDEVEMLIESASAGRIKQSFFMPLPSAHPLCYGVAYLLVQQGQPHSLTELLEPQQIAGHLTNGYLLHPTAALENDLGEGINRVWSSNRDPALLAAVKQMMRELYPVGSSITVHERQRRAEKQIKTIYVHAHMDEDTYEIGRAIRCPDQVPVGLDQMIGACNYNLFYRQKDRRFWIEPQ